MRHKAMATFVLWGMISPSLILYSIRCGTYAIGNLAERTPEQCLLLVRESSDTAIAIYAIELVVEP